MPPVWCWDRPVGPAAVARRVHTQRELSRLAARGDRPAFLPEVSMSAVSAVLGRRVQLKGLIGKRAMKCPYCDFYFMKNGSDLQRHIWAHEGEYCSRGPEHLPVLACGLCVECVGGSRGLGAPALGIDPAHRDACPPASHGRRCRSRLSCRRTDRSVHFFIALVAVGVKPTSVTPDLKSKCQGNRTGAVSHGGARRVAGAERVSAT